MGASACIGNMSHLMVGGECAAILFLRHVRMSAIFLNKVSKEWNINIR